MDTAALEQSAFDLLDILVPCTQFWITPGRFDQLPAELGIEALPAQIYFLTELYKAVNLIPLKLYTDPENRKRLLAEIQNSLDNAIAQEESMG